MPMKMSRIEYGPRLVLALVAARNDGNADALAALLHDDVVLETADDVTITGRAAVADYWRDRFAHHPPAPIEVEALTGFGHHAVVRWRTPTRRGADFYQFRDELISEWAVYVKA